VPDVVKRRGLLSDQQLEDVLNVRDMTEPGIPGGGKVAAAGG
jgi:fumarate hydratase class II